MPFSPEDKRALSFRAAAIYDRAAAIDRSSVPPTAAPAADAVLRAWNQAFSPGDAAAFERRLRWDGLDRDDIAALTTPEAAARMPIAAWTEWLDEIVTGAADVARDLRAGSDLDPASAPVPFAEIWDVWVRRARRRLLETTSGDALRGVAPSVVDACARQLAIELSRQGELTLLEYFKGWQTADSDGDRYRAFIAHSLDDGLREIVFASPVLARHLSGLTADWIANTREWLERLREDRQEFAAIFQRGDDPGQVVSVDLALSDPHHGRRRVHAVEFASGLRLVYKPRTVAIERVFSEVVAWLNRDLAVPLRVLRVLDRGTHGWVEYATHEPQTSADAVARYYRQAGALMCLTWALRARDLHMENVVATAAGPVLIDLEMLLQPVSQSAARVTDAIGEAHASAIVEESSLSTGLLSLVEITAAGDAQDAGGLRGQRRGWLPLPRRVWKNLGTANVHYVDEPMFSAPGGHEVRLDGVLQNPGDFAGDLLAGFSEAYEALIARRAELLAAAGGPLARFEVCSTRVLPRVTNQYAMLSYVLAAPKYQRDGAMRAAAIDVLHRAFSAAAAKPELWEVAVEERRALDRLDVPYFSVRCGDTDATAEGRLVARGYFARSGIAAAAARLSAMSARDHAIQRDLIARALGESVDTVFSTPAPAGSPVAARPSGGVDRPEFLDAAIWIAQELLSRAARAGDSLSWPYRLTADAGRSDHHLYDGSLGPAVFFAGLASVVPDPTWRSAAVAALAPVRDYIRRGQPASGRENIGGLSGLGSIVYALGLASSSLGDPEWGDLAFAVADTIDARIDDDDCLDVVDGAAGAVLALLGLHAASGDERPLTIASRCGRHLLDRAVAIGDGSAWPSADGQRLVGFAHGAAGVVHALARLHTATGDGRWAEAVDRGCQFIAGQFLPTHANFAMAAPQAGAPASGHRVMTAWCHGAPGVALGVASALDIRQKPAILAGFDVALRTTARPDVIQPDHLCCGTLGRAEVLLTLGRRLGRVELEQAGVQLATGVLARAVARRHFRLTGAGSEYRVFDPGFFRGLSGIGYEMLRLSAPDRVPSVAALEPPVGSPSRVQELA
jgi:type 2 lantibiotic biosynthesis protein LanM